MAFKCGKGTSAKKKAADTPDASCTKREFVVRIRKALACSQAELARILGVSGKAIQSYEQGWRTVPTHVLSHLLILLDDFQRRSLPERKPCWAINRCRRETVNKCPVGRLSTGRRCWAIANSRCRVLGCRQKDAGFPLHSCQVMAELCARL